MLWRLGAPTAPHRLERAERRVCTVGDGDGATDEPPCRLRVEAAAAALHGHARLVNGTMVRFTARQRPQIVFADDGSMTPKFMVTAGSFDGYNQDLYAHERTFIFEFESRPAWRQ